MPAWSRAEIYPVSSGHRHFSLGPVAPTLGLWCLQSPHRSCTFAYASTFTRPQLLDRDHEAPDRIKPIRQIQSLGTSHSFLLPEPFSGLSFHTIFSPLRLTLASLTVGGSFGLKLFTKEKKYRWWHFLFLIGRHHRLGSTLILRGQLRSHPPYLLQAGAYVGLGHP